MKWDQKKFVNNVQWIIDNHCNRNASVFNERVGQRDAMTRWKKPEYRPSLAVLLEITEHFPVTIDWLLTGEVPNNQVVAAVTADQEQYGKKRPPPGCVGLEEYCPKFKNIILSDHRVIKDAFIANLVAFDYSINKEKEHGKKIAEQDGKIDNLVEEIRELRLSLTAGQSSGIVAVASSNTGKSGT